MQEQGMQVCGVLYKIMKDINACVQGDTICKEIEKKISLKYVFTQVG